jgi:hypothetical protein
MYFGYMYYAMLNSNPYKNSMRLFLLTFKFTLAGLKGMTDQEKYPGAQRCAISVVKQRAGGNNRAKS